MLSYGLRKNTGTQQKKWNLNITKTDHKCLKCKLCRSCKCLAYLNNKCTHTHTHLTALCPGLPRWAGTRKVKSIWILWKQEIESGSGISWNICKSAPRSRQITTPAPHHSVFYRPDALPAAQPTVSKHWRHIWTTNATTQNQQIYIIHVQIIMFLEVCEHFKTKTFPH